MATGPFSQLHCAWRHFQSKARESVGQVFSLPLRDLQLNIVVALARDSGKIEAAPLVSADAAMCTAANSIASSLAEDRDLLRAGVTMQGGRNKNGSNALMLRQESVDLHFIISLSGLKKLLFTDGQEMTRYESKSYT